MSNIEKSESIESLAKALSLFQSEVANPANTANNPFFKSKYAPLNEVLNLVRPLLTKNGLSVIQSTSSEGDSVIVTTMILHESGEWIRLDPLSLKADKNTAQGFGSAITYGRRYSISAALGISSEDDDDGNVASGNKDNKPNVTNSPQKNTPPKKNIELDKVIKSIDTLAKEKVNIQKLDKDKLFEKIEEIAKTKDYTKINNLDTAKQVLDKVKEYEG